jgi:hypothetical protein
MTLLSSTSLSWTSLSILILATHEDSLFVFVIPPAFFPQLTSKCDMQQKVPAPHKSITTGFRKGDFQVPASSCRRFTHHTAFVLQALEYCQFRFKSDVQQKFSCLPNAQSKAAFSRRSSGYPLHSAMLNCLAQPAFAFMKLLVVQFEMRHATKSSDFRGQYKGALCR